MQFKNEVNPLVDQSDKKQPVKAIVISVDSLVDSPELLIDRGELTYLKGKYPKISERNCH